MVKIPIIRILKLAKPFSPPPAKLGEGKEAFCPSLAKLGEPRKAFLPSPNLVGGALSEG
jgi:hypothetical protein